MFSETYEAFWGSQQEMHWSTKRRFGIKQTLLSTCCLNKNFYSWNRSSFISLGYYAACSVHKWHRLATALHPGSNFKTLSLVNLCLLLFLLSFLFFLVFSELIMDSKVSTRLCGHQIPISQSPQIYKALNIMIDNTWHAFTVCVCLCVTLKWSLRNYYRADKTTHCIWLHTL